MVDETKGAGLLIDPVRLAQVMNHSPAPARPWAETVNNSLTWPWWPAELVPKMTRWNDGRRTTRCGLWGHREIRPRELIDEAALRRIRDKALNYRPANLSQRFLAQVDALFEVPGSMAYVP
jgi:hypothetical protein